MFHIVYPWAFFIHFLLSAFLVKASFAVIKHHNYKQPGKERVYLAYYSQFILTEGSWGRNMEEGIEAEAIDGSHLLAISL